MSMDEYLTVMKETTENLDDAGVPLPDPMVVWYTLKNLPKDYDILKQMILGDKLPTYSELKMRLLSEEMVKKGYVNEKEGEALAVYQNPHHRFLATDLPVSTNLRTREKDPINRTLDSKVIQATVGIPTWEDLPTRDTPIMVTATIIFICEEATTTIAPN
jgi:hypothetical protein